MWKQLYNLSSSRLCHQGVYFIGNTFSNKTWGGVHKLILNTTSGFTRGFIECCILLCVFPSNRHGPTGLYLVSLASHIILVEGTGKCMCGHYYLEKYCLDTITCFLCPKDCSSRKWSVNLSAFLWLEVTILYYVPILSGYVCDHATPLSLRISVNADFVTTLKYLASGKKYRAVAPQQT